MDTLPYDMACGCGGKTAMKYSTCLITLGFHRAQGMMSSMQRLWRNLGRPRRTNLSIKYIYPVYTTLAFMYSWPGLHFFMHERVSVIC